MSFGSDTPGGRVEGIGGREGGIGSGGGGGRDSVLSALNSLSVPQQEALFRQKIDPMMTSAYGPTANLGWGAAGLGINGMLNMAAPGLGTLAGLSGLTGKFTDYLQDRSVHSNLASMLGVQEPRQQMTQSPMQREGNGPASQRHMALLLQSLQNRG